MSKTTHHPCDVEDLEYDPSVCRECGCVLIDDEACLCPDCAADEADEADEAKYYAIATLRLTHPDDYRETADQYAAAYAILCGEPEWRRGEHGNYDWEHDGEDDSTYYATFEFSSRAARDAAIEAAEKYWDWHFDVAASPDGRQWGEVDAQ